VDVQGILQDGVFSGKGEIPYPNCAEAVLFHRIFRYNGTGTICMRSKYLLITFLVIILVSAVVFLWPTDESRIKKLFKEGAMAVEAKDLDGVMAKVSYRYTDDYGMAYLYLKERLKREFSTLSDITVEYEAMKIRVSDNNAVTEVDIRVIATSGKETGYIIGDIKEPLHLRFTLEKERMKWLIVKTEGNAVK
jgi:hypothetical protein